MHVGDNSIQCKYYWNKNAFQEDAYRPLVDRMLESASRGGGVWSREGVSGLGGGLCLLGGGVCSWEGGVCSQWGSGPMGGGLVRGVWSGGWYPSMHWGRHPPWTEWMTDRCKNITLATTSLRPVNICRSDLDTSHWRIREGGVRDARGSKFFQFHAVFGKK